MMFRTTLESHGPPFSRIVLRLLISVGFSHRRIHYSPFL